VDIHSILIDLGFSLQDRGAFWQTSAIWRGGDNPSAVQIYKDSGTWKDYVEEKIDQVASMPAVLAAAKKNVDAKRKQSSALLEALAEVN
jgi:hypothetical protein